MNEAIRLVETGSYVMDKGRWKWVRRGVIHKEPVMQAIETFNAVIDSVEARCMAADGPVTPTLSEMREVELRRLWLAVQTIQKAMNA